MNVTRLRVPILLLIVLVAPAALAARRPRTPAPAARESVERVAYAYQVHMGTGLFTFFGQGNLELPSRAPGWFTVSGVNRAGQFSATPTDSLPCRYDSADYAALIERIAEAGLLRDSLLYPGFDVWPDTNGVYFIGHQPPAVLWWYGDGPPAPLAPSVRLAVTRSSGTRTISFWAAAREAPPELLRLSDACQEMAEHCRAGSDGSPRLPARRP